MSIRTHSRYYKFVEFLYDETVYSPADSRGTAGETRMLPEPLARKLKSRGVGRLTSEIVTEEELEGKPEEPKVLSENIISRLESAGFIRSPEAMKQEKDNDNRAEGKASEPHVGSDIQSGDGSKKKSIPNRRSGKGVGLSSGGSGSSDVVPVVEP